MSPTTLWIKRESGIPSSQVKPPDTAARPAGCCTLQGEAEGTELIHGGAGTASKAGQDRVKKSPQRVSFSMQTPISTRLTVGAALRLQQPLGSPGLGQQSEPAVALPAHVHRNAHSYSLPRASPERKRAPKSRTAFPRHCTEIAPFRLQTKHLPQGFHRLRVEGKRSRPGHRSCSPNS